MHSTVRQICSFLLILFFLVTAGCSAKKKAAPLSGKRDSVQTVRSGTAGVKKKKLVFGTLKGDREKEKEKPPVLSRPASGDISLELMAAVPSGKEMVEDTVIGPLQRYDDSLTMEEKTLYRTIEAFFTGISLGKIPLDSLHPLWKDKILRTMGAVSLNKNFVLRIGKFIHREGNIDIRIRVLTSKGRSSGEILAEKYDDKWFISDIAFDFNLLQKRYVRKNKEFEPDSYMTIQMEYE